jgi:hypothetical protein
MQKFNFPELERLLEQDPAAFREEVLRMYVEAPELFDSYVEWWRERVSRMPEATRERRRASIRALVIGDTGIRRKLAV